MHAVFASQTMPTQKPFLLCTNQRVVDNTKKKRVVDNTLANGDLYVEYTSPTYVTNVTKFRWL